MRTTSSSISLGAIVLGTTLACGCPAPAAEPSCPQLAGSKSEQMLEYLKGDRPSLSPECIEFALTRLGADRYLPALDAIISYLDFRRPGTTSVGPDVLVRPQWATGDGFPAARALIDFKAMVPDLRPTAVSHLVSAIGISSTPDLVRTNATEVLLFMNDDPSRSISALTQAGKASEDQASAQLLRDAARKLAIRCRRPETRAACEAALH
jgi:hypothetical protein